MIALITAVLAAAKPLLDDLYFNNVMSYVNQYVDNEKAMTAELALWPSIDDAKMAMMKQLKITLEDALTKQAAVIQVKASS
jgi:hypothetical protein